MKKQFDWYKWMDRSPYFFVSLAILVVLVSFFFRESAPDGIEQKLEQKYKHAIAQETGNGGDSVKPESETDYKPAPVPTETTYTSSLYPSLTKNNPFRVLVPRPVQEQKAPEKLPLLDLVYATRNWRLLGPMPGIPEMNIPNKMMIETKEGEGDETITVAVGDKVTAKSRDRGDIEVEVRSIDLMAYTLTIGCFDKDNNQDVTRTINMF